MLKNFWPVLAWSLLILILTGLPGTVMPRVGTFWNSIGSDKLGHFFLYAIFFYLLLKSTAKQQQTSKLTLIGVLILLLVGIIFAGLTEILQDILFINRNGNLYDFIANTVGCIAGLMIYILPAKKK